MNAAGLSARYFGVKGTDTLPIVSGTPRQIDKTKTGKTIAKGIRYWPIGSSVVKSELYAQLKLEPPEDGESFPRNYVHFPEDYGPEYFQQLTAEELRSKILNGYKKFYWEKIYERNEALDTFVYARAVLNIIGADRWSDKRWAKIAIGYGDSSQGTAPRKERKERPTSEDDFW